MRFIYSYILLALSMLSPGLAFADECTTWGCQSTISDIVTQANGVILVGTPLDETLANCSAAQNKFFTLDPSANNAEEIYSTLLAAYMANKKIQLRIVESTSGCEISYVKLSDSL